MTDSAGNKKRLPELGRVTPPVASIDTEQGIYRGVLLRVTVQNPSFSLRVARAWPGGFTVYAAGPLVAPAGCLAECYAPIF
jgi:hypothetical protein